MKKIFLSFVILLTLLINTNSFAAEVVLYSEDGLDIKSDAFIQNEAKQISVVKNSNLNIVFTQEKDFAGEVLEPEIDLKVFKKGTKEVVFSLKTPSQKMSGNEGAVFDKYLTDNKLYFENVAIVNNQININIPLKLEGGEYEMSFVLNNVDNKKNVKYSFIVSDSPYMFTTSDIIVEDVNILANIGYISLLENDQINTVTVTLTQDGVELFKKEYEQNFYTEGSISIDEKIDTLSTVKGVSDLKIEIKDSEGKVILTQLKSINILKSSNKYLYYMILGILLLLMIVVFFVVKSKKTKIIAFVLVISFMGTTTLLTSKVNAAVCGGVAKPADRCVENKIITSVCKLDESNECSTNDVRIRKYFSTGRVLNIPSERESPGPTSVSVNVCNNIADNFVSGHNFYVISDSNGSAWQKKRYSIFSFRKGARERVTFDPGGDKRNVNYAEYNGECTVTVYGRYSGRSSDFKSAKTTIVEVGRSSSSVCKSRLVNSDLFQNNGDLLKVNTCSNTDNSGLRNTYIAGSFYMQPISGSNSWSDRTVNICDYLGIKSSDIAGLRNKNKSFYTLMEQTSSWTMIRFPVFEFKFGVVYINVNEMGDTGTDANTHNIKYRYRYNAAKENVPSVAYNGACDITFRLYNKGDDTDSWSSGYSLIETGFVDDATCKDKALTESSTYKLDGKKISKGEVEFETKAKIDQSQWPGGGGRYANIAPFFYNLPSCKIATNCSAGRIDYSWIDSATDKDCGTGYTVTYDSQNATTPANPATSLVTPPATTVNTLPSNPQKIGYTFDGWYTAANGGGTQFTSNTNVTSNMTVYAKWTLIPPLTDLTAVCTGTAGNQVTFSWKIPTGYSSVYFRMRAEADLTDNQSLWDENVQSNSKVVNITPGVKYIWWAHTRDSVGAYSATEIKPVECNPNSEVKVDGQCSTDVVNKCVYGNFVEATDTDSQHKWTCSGLNGGASSPVCSILKTPSNTPVCSTLKYQCNNGVSDTASQTQTDTTYNWNCKAPAPATNYVSCSSNKSDEPGTTSTTTTITVTKKPSVTLNKGGNCTVSWEIKNLPDESSCTLSGWGVNSSSPNSFGNITISNSNSNLNSSKTIMGLETNQKYIINCSGGTINPPITDSVICRVNPVIIEN